MPHHEHLLHHHHLLLLLRRRHGGGASSSSSSRGGQWFCSCPLLALYCWLRCGAPAFSRTRRVRPALPLRFDRLLSLRSAMPRACAAVRRQWAGRTRRSRPALPRCASIGSYSLRSAMPRAALRCAGGSRDAPGPAGSALFASIGSYSLRSAMPRACAAVRAALSSRTRRVRPALRCASIGSSSLRSAMPRAALRCAGIAGRTGYPSSSPAAASLGWLLLAALGNPLGSGAVRRPEAGRTGSGVPLGPPRRAGRGRLAADPLDHGNVSGCCTRDAGGRGGSVTASEAVTRSARAGAVQ